MYAIVLSVIVVLTFSLSSAYLDCLVKPEQKIGPLRSMLNPSPVEDPPAGVYQPA